MQIYTIISKTFYEMPDINMIQTFIERIALIIFFQHCLIR